MFLQIIIAFKWKKAANTRKHTPSARSSHVNEGRVAGGQGMRQPSHRKVC